MVWSAVTSLNSPREGLAVANAAAPAPLPGFRIYAVGGDEGGPPVGVVEAYDPAANSWTVLAGSLPTPRTNLAAAAANGVIHAVGGSDGSGPLATHEIYNPVTGAWTSAPPLPTARANLAAVTGPDGRIYAIGGVAGPAGSPSYLGVVEVYDPAAGGWAAGPPMPTPRGRARRMRARRADLRHRRGKRGGRPDQRGGAGTPVAISGGPCPRCPPARSRTGRVWQARAGSSTRSAAWTISAPRSRPCTATTRWPCTVVGAARTADAAGMPGGRHRSGRAPVRNRRPGAFRPERQRWRFDAGSAQRAGPVHRQRHLPEPRHYPAGQQRQPGAALAAPPAAPGTRCWLPNTDYGIQAVVSNDAATPANDTVVRFSALPGRRRLGRGP